MFCNQCEQTAQQAADDPKTDDLFRPPDIRIASGVRPTEQRRNVLQADNNTGNERTVSQLVMDISRQHGKRQADGTEPNNCRFDLIQRHHGAISL